MWAVTALILFSVACNLAYFVVGKLYVYPVPESDYGPWVWLANCITWIIFHLNKFMHKKKLLNTKITDKIHDNLLWILFLSVPETIFDFIRGDIYFIHTESIYYIHVAVGVLVILYLIINLQNLLLLFKLYKSPTN